MIYDFLALKIMSSSCMMPWKQTGVQVHNTLWVLLNKKCAKKYWFSGCLNEKKNFLKNWSTPKLLLTFEKLVKIIEITFCRLFFLAFFGLKWPPVQCTQFTFQRIYSA